MCVRVCVSVSVSVERGGGGGGGAHVGKGGGGEWNCLEWGSGERSGHYSQTLTPSPPPSSNVFS